MSGKKYEISIIGSYGFGKDLRDGQTIKTRELTKLLAEEFGAENIHSVDTHGWKKNPLKLFFGTIKACRRSREVIMLPAHGAVKVIPRLALASRRRGVKLFYSVIGGWLPEFLQDKPGLAKALKKLDGIWVETSAMKVKLENTGFKNVTVVPNFKDLEIINETELTCYVGETTEEDSSSLNNICEIPEELLTKWLLEHSIPRTENSPKEEPLVFSIFSRITKTKGIGEAIAAITKLNQIAHRNVAILKIYGKIEESYLEEFNNLLKKNFNIIQYKGVISASESTKVLKDSYMLLFPTYYPGEGLAGTIIDAYAAGVPVIASDWRYNCEIVHHGVTGLIYDTFSTDQLLSTIVYSIQHPGLINKMKINCLKEADRYTLSKAKQLILDNLERYSVPEIP